MLLALLYQASAQDDCCRKVEKLAPHRSADPNGVESMPRKVALALLLTSTNVVDSARKVENVTESGVSRSWCSVFGLRTSLVV